MKGLFGLIGLLVVLAVVMWNAKHALTAATHVTAPAATAAGQGVPALPQGTPQQQVDAVARQVQDAVNQGAAARASEIE